MVIYQCYYPSMIAIYKFKSFYLDIDIDIGLIIDTLNSLDILTN